MGNGLGKDEYCAMEKKKFIDNICNAFFDGLTPSALAERCPNRMLWEAIKRENACNIEMHDIFSRLLQQDEFFFLPEPVPAIQNGIEPEFRKVKAAGLLLNDGDSFWDFIWKEPAYLVSCDFKWMIALTTENMADGRQLCVLVCGPEE